MAVKARVGIQVGGIVALGALLASTVCVLLGVGLGSSRIEVGVPLGMFVGSDGIVMDGVRVGAKVGVACGSPRLHPVSSSTADTSKPRGFIATSPDVRLC